MRPEPQLPNDEEKKTRVLVVDDNPDDHNTLKTKLGEHGIEVEIVEPDDVTYSQVWDAHVVLVDFEIEPWKDESNTVINEGDGRIGRLPVDGLALASVLRRQVQAKNEKPPTAFAILTGQLDRLATPLPKEYRNYALARLNNLEWIFEKKDDTSQLVRQVVSLNDAVGKLPSRWLPDKEKHSLNVLLGLLEAGTAPSDIDGSPVVDDVVRSLPPLYEVTEWSHGLAILRWLLHRVLPYPCFLLNSTYLAARLGLDAEYFQHEIESNGPLKSILEACEYSGILSNFDGRRWWRSKIDTFLWEQLEGNITNKDHIRALLSQLTQKTTMPSDPTHNPVVCIDGRYKSINKFTSLKEAIRLQPDDWPSYADYAWATPEQIKNEPALSSLVVAEDKGRL